MMRAAIDKKVFWPSLLVIATIGGVIFVVPEAGTAAMDATLSFLSGQFGWLYLWVAFITLVGLVWLAASKYGKIKLGRAEDRPQFSTVSWIAMIFTAGIGGGIMYWGAIEWAYYYTDPPFGMQSGSVEAAHWAATYPMHHWGFIGWAIYCLPALPLAYVYHVRRSRTLRLSDACRGFLGHHVDKWPGRVIDVLFIFGMVGAAGTSLGLEVPIVARGLSELTPLAPGLGLEIGVIVLWTLIFGASVYLGLRRGLKRLADLNVWIALALGIFLLVAGPTVFILDTFTNSAGLLMQNFLHMSLYTDPVGGSGFEESWTVFYWGWWIAYAPFVGLFTAKISRGRSIRSLILTMCGAGTLGNWIAFALLGNTGLYFETNNVVSITTVLENQGPAAAIVATLQALPLGAVVLAIFTLLVIIFLATTLDSSAYTMAAVATRDLPSEEDPARWHRLVWAGALATVAVALMWAGGLDALQTLAVITGFPLIFVLGIATLSFRRWIRDGHPNGEVFPVEGAVPDEYTSPVESGKESHPSPQPQYRDRANAVTSDTSQER